MSEACAAVSKAGVPNVELCATVQAVKGNVDCDAWTAGSWAEVAARRTVTKLVTTTGDKAIDNSKEVHKLLLNATTAGLELQAHGKELVAAMEEEARAEAKARAVTRRVLHAWVGCVRRALPGRRESLRIVRVERARAQAWAARLLVDGEVTKGRAAGMARDIQSAAATLIMSLDEQEEAARWVGLQAGGRRRDDPPARVHAARRVVVRKKAEGSAAASGAVEATTPLHVVAKRSVGLKEYCEVWWRTGCGARRQGWIASCDADGRSNVVATSVLTVATHAAAMWRAAVILRAWQRMARAAHAERGIPSLRAVQRWSAAAEAGVRISVGDTQAASAAQLMWAALGNSDSGGRPAAAPKQGATLRGVAVDGVALRAVDSYVGSLQETAQATGRRALWSAASAGGREGLECVLRARHRRSQMLMRTALANYWRAGTCSGTAPLTHTNRVQVDCVPSAGDKRRRARAAAKARRDSRKRVAERIALREVLQGNEADDSGQWRVDSIIAVRRRAGVRGLALEAQLRWVGVGAGDEHPIGGDGRWADVWVPVTRQWLSEDVWREAKDRYARQQPAEPTPAAPDLTTRRRRSGTRQVCPGIGGLPTVLAGPLQQGQGVGLPRVMAEVLGYVALAQACSDVATGQGASIGSNAGRLREERAHDDEQLTLDELVDMRLAAAGAAAAAQHSAAHSASGSGNSTSAASAAAGATADKGQATAAAAATSDDGLTSLLCGYWQRREDERSTKAQVEDEMARRMDNGVRVNAALAPHVGAASNSSGKARVWTNAGAVNANVSDSDSEDDIGAAQAQRRSAGPARAAAAAAAAGVGAAASAVARAGRAIVGAARVAGRGMARIAADVDLTEERELRRLETGDGASVPEVTLAGMLRRKGLRHSAVPGDGACLYWAIMAGGDARAAQRMCGYVAASATPLDRRNAEDQEWVAKLNDMRRRAVEWWLAEEQRARLLGVTSFNPTYEEYVLRCVHKARAEVRRSIASRVTPEAGVQRWSENQAAAIVTAAYELHAESPSTERARLSNAVSRMQYEQRSTDHASIEVVESARSRDGSRRFMREWVEEHREAAVWGTSAMIQAVAAVTSKQIVLVDERYVNGRVDVFDATGRNTRHDWAQEGWLRDAHGNSRRASTLHISYNGLNHFSGTTAA